MAKSLLFCGENTTENLSSIGKSTECSYENGILTIFRDSKVIFSEKAGYREGFQVVSNRKETTVRKITLPKDKKSLLACLCGTTYESICLSEEKYYSKLAEYYTHIVPKNVVKSWEVVSKNYRFSWNRKGGEYTRNYCIACKIDDDKMTVEEILSMLPMMLDAGYPEWYLLNVLGERFGVTPEEFDKSLKM